MYFSSYFTLLQGRTFISTWLLLANAFFMFISFYSIVFFFDLQRILAAKFYYFYFFFLNFKLLEMLGECVISSFLSCRNKKLKRQNDQH